MVDQHNPIIPRARSGMSAHLLGWVIMNNHATRLGLVGVYGSIWDSSCARK
jgi:hypothetical protein